MRAAPSQRTRHRQTAVVSDCDRAVRVTFFIGMFSECSDRRSRIDVVDHNDSGQTSSFARLGCRRLWCGRDGNLGPVHPHLRRHYPADSQLVLAVASVMMLAAITGLDGQTSTVRMIADEGEAAQSWARWRGPSGQGVVTGTGYRDKWSATQNVWWKIRVGINSMPGGV
jgi:hypothetical protein